MIVTQKANKMVMQGHDASCPQEKLGNNMARAQFLSACGHAQAGIVPLQKIIEIQKLKFTKRNNYISFCKKNLKQERR